MIPLYVDEEASGRNETVKVPRLIIENGELCEGVSSIDLIMLRCTERHRLVAGCQPRSVPAPGPDGRSRTQLGGTRSCRAI